MHEAWGPGRQAFEVAYPWQSNSQGLWRRERAARGHDPPELLLVSIIREHLPHEGGQLPQAPDKEKAQEVR